MSIQSEVERISQNVQNTLDTIRQTGVSVPESATSDDLPAAATALSNEKQDKLTGAAGQIVGFGEDGSAQPEDFPGLTQAQGDERYLPQTGGTVTGQLRLAMNENSGSLYFGESIDGSDGMIVSQAGRMILSTGSGANSAAVTINKSNGSIVMQTRNGTSGSDAGTLNFSPSGLDMNTKPILNCPTLDGKQDKLTGTQGQIVGFDESGNAVAQEAPQGGITQEQADQRYLQLTGGTISGGTLRLVPNKKGEALYFGRSIGGFDGFDGMITSSDGSMGIKVGAPTMNTVSVALEESTGELYFYVKNGSTANDAGVFTFRSNGLDMGAKPITNCPSFPLVFGPKTVATSAWAANTTYSAQGYGFRASVPLSGVTIDHIPDVTFAMADAVSGNLAPLADTYMGGIYIYAKEQPSAIVNIASVVCTKEV